MSKSAWLLGLALGSCAGSSAIPTGSEAGGAGGMSANGGAPTGGVGGTAAQAGSGGSGTAGFGGAVSSGGSRSGGFTGGGGSSGGGASGGSSGSGASLADVQALFDSRCVICHDKSKGGLPTYPQLSLLATDALSALVNKAATEPCGGTLVVPGDPDHSYLIHKLVDDTPCDGMRMPRSFSLLPSPPFTTSEMTTIRSWISAGAKP